MVEEFGEVARAVGTLEGRPVDPEGRIADLGGEAIDVLLMLISIVNRYDIDLEAACRAKRNATTHAAGGRSDRSGAP